MPCMDEDHYDYIKDSNWRWLFEGEVSDWIYLTASIITQQDNNCGLPDVILEWMKDKQAEKSFPNFPDNQYETIRIRNIRRHSSPAASLLCLSVCYAKAHKIKFEMPPLMLLWWEEHLTHHSNLRNENDFFKILEEETKNKTNLKYYLLAKEKYGRRE